MKKIDLTGMRFGMLYVKCEAPVYVSPKGYKKSMWECHCDCGNDCVVMGSHLTSGHSKSCGCQKTKNLTPRKANDLTGRRFGMLTVLHRLPNRIIGRNSRVIWRCRCDCGRESDVLALLLTEGLVKSCGCLSVSHAERNMFDYLRNNQLDYIFQYHPTDLYGVGGGALFFDFALRQNNEVKLLIELDGIQHYKVVAYFGGIKKYEQLKANDMLKNEWVKQHSIEFIRINVSNCKTDESFIDLYDEKLRVHIDELTNSLNIG